MTAQYAGASFETRTSQNGLVPRWSQPARASVRAIPYADRDDVQFTGKGNRRLTLPVYVASDADMATLEAAVDGTRRTLANPFGSGESYGNVLLLSAGSPRRRGWAQEWFTDLNFMQVP